MKSLTSYIGIILIIAGILLLGYEGFTYTKHEKVAEIGDVAVVEDTQKTVYLSPWYGVTALAAGIVLVVVGRRGGSK